MSCRRFYITNKFCHCQFVHNFYELCLNLFHWTHKYVVVTLPKTTLRILIKLGTGLLCTAWSVLYCWLIQFASICKYLCVCVCVCVCVDGWMDACMHPSMNAQACIYVCMYVCMYVGLCMYVCMHVCMCVKQCARIYIYLYRMIKKLNTSKNILLSNYIPYEYAV
jgi:hypothetical protein